MNDAARYFGACPKVELHVHLEGAVRPRRVLALAARHGDVHGFRRPEDVAHLFQHHDFAEFLLHFRTVVQMVRDERDVHDIAEDLLRELRAQNVVYAEVIFSAPIFVRQGMAWDALLHAVTDAAETVEREIGGGQDPSPGALPRFYFVIDLVRNFGATAARTSVEALAAIAHPRVRGIHLGGDECAFPGRDFAAAFAAAREAGLGCAAHAGEADGPASVRDAIERLGVTRIGHGIRSIEDPALLRRLVERDITLEVCPTSNLRTGVVADWPSHPLARLIEAGVGVTLGADDPSYFDTDLESELNAAHASGGLSIATLDRCTDRGIEAAFAPAAERSARLVDLRAERAALVRQLTSRAT